MTRPKLDAKNSDGARNLFQKRKDYKDLAVKTGQLGQVPSREAVIPIQELDSVKDFSNGKRYLAGKVETNQFAVLPKVDMISAISYSDESTTAYAFDFVATAFGEMARRYDRLLAANRIIIDSPSGTPVGPLESIRAVSGYQSSLRLFVDFNTSYFENLILATPKRRKDRINNLKDFVRFYTDVLLSNSLAAPFFLSDFIKSDFNPITSTGLAVEIASALYSDDAYKVDNFLKSPNYPRYVQLAQEFGFMIDKQVPWRLVADIDSKAMRRRLMGTETEGMGIENVLHEYYDVVDTNDFVIMLNNIYTAYSYFIGNNRFSNRTSSEQEDSCNARVIFRNPVEIMSLSQIPTQEWVMLYVKLKNKFSGIEMGDIELNRIMKLEGDKVGYADLGNIVTSINRKFNFTPLDQGSTTYRELQVKLRESESLTDPLQQIKDFYVASLMNQY